MDESGDDVGPGEVERIITYSRHFMVVYYRNPDHTSGTIVNGWLHTRYMGTYDDRGNIYTVDQKEDMIVSGGENIYLREAKEVLYKHPAIQEAAIIGIPDPYWIERAHALVILEKVANLTADELIAFCKKNLAGYKATKWVELWWFTPQEPHLQDSKTRTEGEIAERTAKEPLTILH